jgi:hypothetical protein
LSHYCWCARAKLIHILSVCVCRPSYPTCNEHASCYHVCVCVCVQYIYIYIYFHIWQMARFSEKKVVEHKKCISFSCTYFVWNISHSKKNWAKFINHVKYSLFSSDLNESWIFSTDFRNIIRCKISWKWFQLEPSCSMRTDRHIWRDLIVASAILRTLLKSGEDHIYLTFFSLFSFNSSS